MEKDVSKALYIIEKVLHVMPKAQHVMLTWVVG